MRRLILKKYAKLRPALLFITVFTVALTTMTIDSLAYRHAYKRKTDYIYATCRQVCSIYAWPDGSDFQDYLPEFTGVAVIDEDGAWYQVRYKKHGQPRTGWMTKEEFNWGCLLYDGRDKQPAADGVYTAEQSAHLEEDPVATVFSKDRIITTDQMQLHLVYVSDHCYRIKNETTGLWLCPASTVDSSVNSIKDRQASDYAKEVQEQSTEKNFNISDFLKPDESSEEAADARSRTPVYQLWGSKKQAGLFTLVREGSCYSIIDHPSKKYFVLQDSGLLGFSFVKYNRWVLTRNEKAVDDESIRDYTQIDGEWANYHYGHGRERTSLENNFCTSGCGIFATVNAIYSLTGHFASPYELAEYAVDHYYRIEGSGTDAGFFEAASDAFGSKYGFEYAGTVEYFDDLIAELNAGNVAITYVPGHYTTIVDYNKKRDEFLLLDPHYLPKRATCSFGDWVPRKNLEEGDLFAMMYYIYKPAPIRKN